MGAFVRRWKYTNIKEKKIDVTIAHCIKSNSADIMRHIEITENWTLLKYTMEYQIKDFVFYTTAYIKSYMES